MAAFLRHFVGGNQCHKVPTIGSPGSGSGRSGTITRAMVTITERAAAKALALLAAENDPELTGLRVAVEGGGCSGFQYALGFDGAPEDGDRIVVVNGLRIIVDI